MTCKQHAKELLLQQRECDITINGMKRTMRSALKRKNMMSSAILQKQAAKSRVVIKRYKRDNATLTLTSISTIKCYKMENATSKATICNLEEKMAAFEATLEQLTISHESAMIDLTTTY